MTSNAPLRVVVAGGGVAAIETVLALHDLAGDRVRVTLVAPEPEFALRALRTAEPFAADHVRTRSLADVAERAGAELRPDALVGVQPERHAVRLAGGDALEYDALVIAVGARHRTAFLRALTFTGDERSTVYNGLLADLEQGWSRSVAFVVPPGTTWPLPIYELALQTAAHVHAMGVEGGDFEVISTESAPLALFGQAASDAVSRLLEQAGVRFSGETEVVAGEDGSLLRGPGGERIAAQRTVALPTIEGPAIVGLPADQRGFIPIDAECRVVGLEDVYAAGDGTTYPVKQGGLATQQADAIASQLAARAGADVQPEPFRPVLRGQLLTGQGAQPLGGDGRLTPLRLWSAPHKVNGRYLSAWLAEGEPQGAEAPAGAAAGAVEVDVELPNPWQEARGAIRLDPYSPIRH